MEGHVLGDDDAKAEFADGSVGSEIISIVNFTVQSDPYILLRALLSCLVVSS